MNYVFATLVVTNAVRNNLKALSDRLDKQHCQGMFIVGLSATGNAPATHWISSGLVPAPYLNAVTNNVRLFNLAKAAWEADGDVFPYTQAQVTNALGNCDISTDGPFVAMARMGLQFVGGSL